VAGVATRSYEERLPRDSPHIVGEFVPVNSNAVIVEALLLVIPETCVDLEGDGKHLVGRTSCRHGLDSRHRKEIFVKFVGVCIDRGEP